MSPLWSTGFLYQKEPVMSTVDKVDPDTGEILDELETEVGNRRPFRISMASFFAKLARRNQTASGEEIVNSVPMQPPLGYKRQPTMVEYIREQIRSENLRLAAEAAGAETFEEADDFDVEDDFEPISAYEFERNFDPLPDGRPGRPEADRPERPEGADEPAASPAPSVAPSSADASAAS